MVLLFFFKNIPPIPVFTLFATVHYWDDFSNVSTGTGRGRRRILRVWGLGREPQQARKAGAQRKIFRKWRAICPACHFCGKGNLARHLHCLPNLPFEKFFSICETKCPCVPYYPYREIFLYWKKVPSDFGLFEPSCHITYMRGFSENSSDKDETKTPLVSYQ